MRAVFTRQVLTLGNNLCCLDDGVRRLLTSGRSVINRYRVEFLDVLFRLLAIVIEPPIAEHDSLHEYSGHIFRRHLVCKAIFADQSERLRAMIARCLQHGSRREPQRVPLEFLARTETLQDKERRSVMQYLLIFLAGEFGCRDQPLNFLQRLCVKRGKFDIRDFIFKQTDGNCSRLAGDATYTRCNFHDLLPSLCLITFFMWFLSSTKTT